MAIAASFLGAAYAMDHFIDGVVATCDYVAAKKRSRRKLKLSFDEWNLWYEARFVGATNLDWAQAPRLIEDEYTAIDAVVAGNLMMSLLRHADRVAIACLAQLVNVIAPIRAESGQPAWRQTIFYPFALTARHAIGDVLRVEPVSPLYSTAQYGDVPLTDVVATRDPETGDTTVFAVNRHQDQPVELRLDVRALRAISLVEHLYLGGSDLDLANTPDATDRITPRNGSGTQIDNGTCSVVLPPISWTMLRLHTGS